jgi:hypothetical protein
VSIRRLGGKHFCSSSCRRLARTMPYAICTCAYGCASPSVYRIATFSVLFVWPIIRSYLAKNHMSGYERAIHTPYGFLRMVWNGPEAGGGGEDISSLKTKSISYFGFAVLRRQRWRFSQSHEATASPRLLQRPQETIGKLTGTPSHCSPSRRSRTRNTGVQSLSPVMSTAENEQGGRRDAYPPYSAGNSGPCY